MQEVFEGHLEGKWRNGALGARETVVYHAMMAKAEFACVVSVEERRAMDILVASIDGYCYLEERLLALKHMLPAFLRKNFATISEFYDSVPEFTDLYHLIMVSFAMCFHDAASVIFRVAVF
jgi:hypothetical protein